MSINYVVLPLRLIFYGSLLCVLDITFSTYSSSNGQGATGFRFDILNDFVGMILVTIGIRKLQGFEVSQSWRTSMKFVFAVSVVATIQAFFAHFVFQTPAIVNAMINVFALTKLVATILFCSCMVRLSVAHKLHRSSASWQITKLLAIIIWCVPLGLLNLTGVFYSLTGQQFHLNLGPLILLLLVLFVVPLIHFYLSTSRMSRESLRPGSTLL